MKTTLKTAILTLAFLPVFQVMGANPPPGKQVFGNVKNTDLVVTQEVDSVFTSWTNGNQVAFKANTTNFWIGGSKLSDLLGVGQETDPMFNNFQNRTWNLKLGGNTYAGEKSVAIGIPWNTQYGDNDFYISRAGDGVKYYWRNDYIGPVYADRESVAIGDSARAGNPVSVAIGDQAIVGSLHPDDGRLYGLIFDRMELTTTYSRNGIIVTTNIITGAFTNYYEISRYERLPAAGDWKKVQSGDPIVVNGTTNIIDVYEQKEVGGLRDISYLTPDEWNYYNRGFYGGQGTVPLNQAYYGVAIGSRSYVFGYHGVALGHYSHVSRPWAMALGSEAHVYSEGAQGIGHDVDIATNAPYSLAVGAYGTVTPGMTNAIVVGVPQIKMKDGIMTVTKRPTAVKNNSINFAYNGNGIQDFFLDGVSLQERLSYETKVVGNSRSGTTEDGVKDVLGITGDNIVFAAGDGKIMLFTKSYIEDQDDSNVHLDEIVINNKPLSQILAEQTPTGGADTEFRVKVQNAATVAQNELATNATNMVQVKAILTNFFNTIKQ